MQPDFLTQAEDLLAEAQTGEALQILRETLALAEATESHDDAFLLLARYNKLGSEERRGTISDEDAQLEYRRITAGALDLIRHLRDHPDELSTLHDTQDHFQTLGKEKPVATGPDGGFLPVNLQRRMGRVKELDVDLKATWLDDSAINQRVEAALIRQLGVDLTVVETTADFRQAIMEDGPFQLHLSCIDLDQEPPGVNGLSFHRQLVAEGVDVPTIFYIGINKREKGTPPYAFGITHSPVELLHLVMDVVERNA